MSRAFAFDEGQNVSSEEASEIIEATQDAKPDYVRAMVGSVFLAIRGWGGDLVVGLSILGGLFLLYRKKYKAAVGCLIIMCGLVVVRVLIALLFDPTEF